MVRVLVLRTGEPVNRVHEECGSFARMFERGLNAPARDGGRTDAVDVDELDITGHQPGDAFPALDRYQGAIMTGSPAYVGDGAPWMKYGGALIEHLIAQDVPLLCVCFGHQLLGQTFGGDVGPNPRGREMGTIEVELHDDVADDPLLAHLPKRFHAQCTHRDVIRRPSAKLRVRGVSAHDPHHVVRAGRRAWGLQFHPEFDDVVMRLYLEERRDALDRDLGPGSFDRRIATLKKTPHAASILPRFAEICGGARATTTSAKTENARGA